MKYGLSLALLFLSLFVMAPSSLAQTVDLKADDGSADGRGLLQNGILCVNRLTPSSYPATLNSVKIFFIQFNNLPDPIGQKVRLVVFTDEEGLGKPSNSPRFIIDQQITIPGVDNFFSFDVTDVTIKSGDFYVGYQTSNPAQGVGFACDTNGFQQERGFFSTNSGQSFAGPLTFQDNTQINLLIRATVFQETNIGPSARLRVSVNPTTVEQNTSRCDAEMPYPLMITIEELNGVKVTITGFRADFFNTNNQPVSSFLLADSAFIELFNKCGTAKSVIAAKGRACADICSGLPSGINSGTLQITFFASDSNGNNQSVNTGTITLLPPNATSAPTINSAVFDGAKTLTITGNSFGSNARVRINGVDRSTKIKASSSTAITVKGKPAKLGIVRGQNTVTVVDASGRVSNMAFFNF
jgi:hypothetical protein